MKRSSGAMLPNGNGQADNDDLTATAVGNALNVDWSTFLSPPEKGSRPED